MVKNLMFTLAFIIFTIAFVSYSKADKEYFMENQKFLKEEKKNRKIIQKKNAWMTLAIGGVINILVYAILLVLQNTSNFS